MAELRHRKRSYAFLLRPSHKLALRRFEPHENAECGTASGLGRGAQGFWPKVKHDGCLSPGGCWLWIGYKDKDGAGRFCTLVDGKARTFRAARYAWELLRGRVPEGKKILACCGRADCVNPDHRIVIEPTALVRTLHEFGHKFEYADNKGEMSGRALLDNEAVLFIRSQPSCYGLAPLLAQLYGVSTVTIQQVRYRRTWKHLGNGNKANGMPLRDLRSLIEQREGETFDLDEQATARCGRTA